MSAPEFKKRTPSGIKPVQRQGHPMTPTGVKPVQRDRLSWHQFEAEPTRYNAMSFRRCGNSGLKLSAISLGSWETFGGYVGPEATRGIIFRAFNLGITHYDLANTYGTPQGRSETIVGRVLREMPREEIVIATKAGFPMWPGAYGEGASRKTLITSLEHSLKRLEMDYVDIFYSHRPDPNTPLEETLRALDQIVRQGKALYVGLSNYPAATLAQARQIVREQNLSPIIANQVGYSMLRRDVERELLPAARDSGVGVVAFSALGQGLLSAKYLNGVPDASRAAKRWSAPQREGITPALVEKLRKLGDIAKARGQTLSQMAIAWTLRAPEVATALIGASDLDQIEENAQALEKPNFGEDELRQIDAVFAS